MPTRLKPARKAEAFTGNNILGHMETMLGMPTVSENERITKYNTLVDLNDRLIPYLRNQNTNKWTGELVHPTPEWDRFPLARSWFSQSVTVLHKLPLQNQEQAVAS